MHPARPRHSRVALSVIGLLAMLASELLTADVRAAPVAGDAFAVATTSHLVVSEVMTGGASASDEFIELYNPSPGTRSLEGLELVYVTASGTTVTRKAAWGAGSTVEPGRHVLVANEAGIFASVADVTYANGLAATGGSIALRAVGGSTAIDSVGWGTAANAWLETAPAPASAAGSSLERLPGGALGSGQDTDHNLVDFVVR
ncbi:MAG TPA: lamin tail domain-containing protein, partial [Candidatus Limnocylindria bacterium]